MSVFVEPSGVGQDPEGDFLHRYEDGSPDPACLSTPLQNPLEGLVVQEKMDHVFQSAAGELSFFDAALEGTTLVGSPIFPPHEPSLAEEVANKRSDGALENVTNYPFQSATALPEPHATLPELIESPYSPFTIPSPSTCPELPDDFLRNGISREIDDMLERNVNYDRKNNIKSQLITEHHEIDTHQSHIVYHNDALYQNHAERHNDAIHPANFGQQNCGEHEIDAGYQNGGDVVLNNALHHRNEQNDEQNSIKSGEENGGKDDTTRSDDASEHEGEQHALLDKPSGSNARQDAVSSLNQADSKALSTVSNNRNEELKRAVTEADKIADEEEFRWIMQRPPPKEKRKDPGNHGQSKNQNPWTVQEEETVKRIVKSMVIVNPEKWYVQVTGGEKRWDIIEDIIRPMGMDRTWSAIKSQWNRTLRESSGIDERRRARTAAMTTGSQPNRRRNEKAKKRKLIIDGEAQIEAEDPKAKKQRTIAKQQDRNTESEVSAPEEKHAQAMGDDEQSQPHNLASKKKRGQLNKGGLVYEDGGLSIAQAYTQNQKYPGEISQSTYMTGRVRHRQPTPVLDPHLQARFLTILGSSQGHGQDNGQREPSLSPLPTRRQGNGQGRAAGERIQARPYGHRPLACPD